MANKLITEKDYPISNKWLLKNAKTLLGLPVILAMIIFNIYFPQAIESGTQVASEPLNAKDLLITSFLFVGIYSLIIGGEVLYNYLRRRFFHFELGSDNLIIHSGIISRQERHMPYSRFQNVLVRQDLLDRLFGIKQVVVENAAGGNDLNYVGATNSFGTSNMDTLGNSGNSLVIPGLRSADAEALKLVILDIITKHTKEDKDSGL